ncbi:MAG TPA: PASTA domain-containing protein, partial [Coriobacteriia bacterium]|nr:PASTA domain-containing protein [Coriobacteriia bacterium]
MSQVEIDPQAGMVPSGSRVVIVVSQGPSAERPGYTEVPQVVGLAQGAALTKLQDAGLQARVVNDYTEAFKRGEVMGQLPNAGVSVVAGSEVVLLVSSGGATHYGSLVVLPDVVGMSETDAVSELQAARLSPQLVREYSPTVPTGVVMSQLPNEAWLSAVPRKKPMWWIWITAGLVAMAVGLAAVYFLMPMTVIVPDVVGLTQEDAIKAIEAANFEVGRVSEAESDKVKEGEVAAQSPHAAVRVREGSKIDIVVSTGEPLLAVPDVVGMSQDDAITQLRAFGLNTRTTTETTSGVDPGQVLEQSPSAGEKVTRGTTV